MKKKLVVALVVMFAVFAASFTVFANSAEDYKVIKRAVDKKSASDKVMWFKILVTEKKTKKQTVKITIPIGVVDMLADSLQGKIKLDGKDGDQEIDLRKMLKELKKNGPLALIEVDDDDEFIKIWLE
jgi:hypothetical protein